MKFKESLKGVLIKAVERVKKDNSIPIEKKIEHVLRALKGLC